MRSSWRERPTLDEIRLVTTAARSAGMLDDERSAVFHSLSLMEQRLAELRLAFPPDTLHTVAVKANPVLDILRDVVAAGHGLEAASFEEVQLALAAGCPAQRVVYDSPAKTMTELRMALELGVHINADSLAELDRIIALHDGSFDSVVGLRINPQVGDGHIPETSVAGARSRFGEPLDNVAQPLAERARAHRWLRGLHYHVGSQGTPPSIHAKAAAAVSGLRDRLHELIGRPQFDVVDIGGGATADYAGEEVTPPRDFASLLRASAPGLFDDATRIVTEFGRAVQGSCGWAVTAVEYTKQVQGEPVAVVHLGADMLLRPAYRPEHWRHRFSTLAERGERAPVGAQRWTITGPLCFAGDVIGRDVALPPLQEGDSLVIHDVGAYTVAMWSRHCSRGMPPILGYRLVDGDPLLVMLRRGESGSDVVRFWSSDPYSR